MGPSPRVRSPYLFSVSAAGLLVLLWSVVAVARDFPGPRWLLLVALTVTTALFVVRMRTVPFTVSLSDAFTVASALLFGPAAGALTVACDAAVMSLRLRRTATMRTRLLFNVTAPALALFAASHLFFAVAGVGPLYGRPLSPAALALPLFAFAAAYFLMNSLLVAGAVGLGDDAPVLQVWRRHFLPLWATHAGGVALGALLVLAETAADAALPIAGIALPLALALAIAVSHGVQRLRQRSAVHGELRTYAAALRSTGDAIILADADDRITYINPAGEALTGWSVDDARGRLAADVLVFEDAAAGEPASGDGASSMREYTLRRRDGGRVSIEQTRSQIGDEDGVTIGVIRTFRDIRPRKRLEAERHALLLSEREAREAADAANRTKDEFLATLSHELRTPATAILGWTSLLRSGRLDDAAAHRALAALDRSARAQATVLNDIVDVSRVVRGTLRLDVRRVHLADVLHEAVETVEPAAAARRLALHLEVERDLPVIDADPDRVRQVLWNLLSNAVKFTREGGRVDVTLRREGGALAVTVADDGEGIDPAFLPYVFDRFRQGDASDTRTHAGLGLGLSIVKHLVEAHGGAVRAESAGRGRGARFTATFPDVRRGRDGDPGAGPAVGGAAAATGPGRRDAEYFEQLVADLGAAFDVAQDQRRLAIAIAHALDAYGVRVAIPDKWRDRRDPRTQRPRPGGRRPIDLRAVQGG